MKTKIKERFLNFVIWSEKYVETDMLYAVKGSFWIIFGKVGLFLISFAKMFVFGRYAEQEVYGVYAFILSMSAMLSIFSLPGVNTSLIKAIAKKKDGTFDTAIKERFKFSLLGSLASLMIAGWYIYNANQSLALAFLVVAFFLPFQYVFPIFLSFWNGRKDFEKRSKYELLSAILVAAVTIPVIIYTNNPILIIIVLFGSQSFFDGLLLLRTRKEKKNGEVLEETIGFGKNLTVIGAISAFVEQVDKIILWKFFGPAQLAIYSFAQLPIRKAEGVIPIIPLALPKMGERNFQEIKVGIMKKFKKLFLISIPLFLVSIFSAPFLYKILFPQYIESVPYFQAFSFILLLSPFTLLSASLISEMRKKDLYIIQTATPFFKIILFLILIPLLQIWGVVLAIVISRLFNGILTFYFFRKL
jgi:O-antigen/teichoic acid export membrane protein